MRVSLLTPTAGRPAGIALCETYMRRQTVQPHEWIVADGGAEPATLTMGQVHLHKPSEPGPRNLASNILRGLEAITGDVVVIVEDDDRYAPDHIARCVELLQGQEACGSDQLRYFNVKHRCWREMRNLGSALCQTAFRSSLIGAMRRAAETAYERNAINIDGLFWERRRHLATGPHGTVIGIKGIGGVTGLGIGHRPERFPQRWKHDPEMTKLREWIGDDVENYRQC